MSLLLKRNTTLAKQTNIKKKTGINKKAKKTCSRFVNYIAPSSHASCACLISS